MNTTPLHDYSKGPRAFTITTSTGYQLPVYHVGSHSTVRPRPVKGTRNLTYWYDAGGLLIDVRDYSSPGISRAFHRTIVQDAYRSIVASLAE